MRSLLSLSLWLRLDIANSFQAAIPRTGPLEACHPVELPDETADQTLQQTDHSGSAIVNVEDTLESLDVDAFLKSFGRHSAATPASTAKQATYSTSGDAIDRVWPGAAQSNRSLDPEFLDTWDDEFNFSTLDPLFGFEDFLNPSN